MLTSRGNFPLGLYSELIRQVKKRGLRSSTTADLSWRTWDGRTRPKAYLSLCVSVRHVEGRKESKTEKAMCQECFERLGAGRGDRAIGVELPKENPRN